MRAQDEHENVGFLATADSFEQIFLPALGSHIWGLLTAICLQLAIIALVLTVIHVDISLSYWSGLSESTKIIYTTGITVLASVISIVSVGSTRKAWFAKLVHDSPASSGRRTHSKLRVLTGLAELKEQLLRLPITVAFVVITLTTTVIVVALTPRSYIGMDQSGAGSICANDTDGFCVNEFARRSTAGQIFNWRLPDGSLIGLDQNISTIRNYCSSRRAVDRLVASIDNDFPPGAAYVLGDTLVSQNAVGMPFDSADVLSEAFGAQRSGDFRWTARCLPVLVRNPVRCRAGGSVRLFEANNSLSVTSGDCVVNSQHLRVSVANQSAAVLGVCTRALEVGKATMLLGAVGETYQDGFESGVRDNAYSQRLAQMINVTIPTGQNREQAVVCDIDVPSAMGMRMLNYSRSDESLVPKSINARKDGQNFTRSGYGYTVTAQSNATCEVHQGYSTPQSTIPLRDLQSNWFLAGAAGASWPLLVENAYDDGYFDTLYRLAGGSVTRSMIFNDSHNALEDVVGGVTAVAMGIQYLGCTGASLTYVPVANAKVRLGPQTPLAHLFLLVPIVVVGLQGWLFWATVRRRRECRS